MDFLLEKVTTLLVPVWIWGIIEAIWRVGLSPDLHLMTELRNRLLGLVFDVRGSDYESGYWFVVCLFLVQVFGWFLLRIKSKRMMIAVMTVLVSLSYVWCSRIGIALPWSFDLVFFAECFFVFGYLFSEQLSTAPSSILYTVLTCVASGLIMGINYLYSGYMVDMFSQHFGNIVLFLLAGVLGSVFILQFCGLIERTTLKCQEMLTYIGKNTLIYYILHLKFVYKALNMTSLGNKDFFGKGIIYVVISGIVILILSIPINKYLPLIVGKKRVEVDGNWRSPQA